MFASATYAYVVEARFGADPFCRLLVLKKDLAQISKMLTTA